MALNHEVEVVCPKCGHQHRRVVANGEIHESGRYATKVKEEICPPMSAYQKNPWTEKMRNGSQFSDRRDGVPIKKSDVPDGHAQAQQILRDSWFGKFGGRG
jgi:hypothetical protein